MNLNGQKFDAGKTEWDLLPLGPVEEIVKVLMHGREKYGRDNWQLVDNPIRRYYAAAQRHLAAFRRARFDTRDPYDAIDAESHLHHLAHAACCVLFLLWHERKELCEEDASGTILDRLMDDLVAARTEAPDTSETDAEFDDALNTLRDLGVIREATTREPVLIREITDKIKFAVYDPNALDKLTARDVQEVESKAFGDLHSTHCEKIERIRARYFLANDHAARLAGAIGVDIALVREWVENLDAWQEQSAA